MIDTRAKLHEQIPRHRKSSLFISCVFLLMCTLSRVATVKSTKSTKAPSNTAKSTKAPSATEPWQDVGIRVLDWKGYWIEEIFKQLRPVVDITVGDVVVIIPVQLGCCEICLRHSKTVVVQKMS